MSEYSEASNASTVCGDFSNILWNGENVTVAETESESESETEAPPEPKIYLELLDDMKLTKIFGEFDAFYLC